jgi:hypothetical protein
MHVTAVATEPADEGITWHFMTDVRIYTGMFPELRTRTRKVCRLQLQRVTGLIQLSQVWLCGCLHQDEQRSEICPS